VLPQVRFFEGCEDIAHKDNDTLKPEGSYHGVNEALNYS
jgi:hypothetical protein